MDNRDAIGYRDFGMDTDDEVSAVALVRFGTNGEGVRILAVQR